MCLTPDGTVNPVPLRASHVSSVGEVRGRSPGTPHVGDLLRLSSVLQAQVLHMKDKESLLVYGKAWIPIASFFKNRNFQ